MTRLFVTAGRMMSARFPRSFPLLLFVFGTLAVVCLIWYFHAPWFTEVIEPVTVIEPQMSVVHAVDREPITNTFNHSTDMPLIFIGGIPRSGATLLRVMLDAHPDIRCGQETQLVPQLLDMMQDWRDHPPEVELLKEAGMTPEIYDPAVASFILEILVRQGTPAPHLCNKDPYILDHGAYLHSLFPNAKFILMLRDGRAVVHSIISRDLGRKIRMNIMNYDRSSYRISLRKWNEEIHKLFDHCLKLGPSYCMPIQYELLVMHPRPIMEEILTFFNAPWNESVLHHEKFVNKPGGVSLSMLEDLADQIIKPINLKSLTTWVGHLPPDVVRDMADIAPMLKTIGYDPNDNHPYFGKPDYSVQRNTEDIENNNSFWSAKEGQIKAIRLEAEKTKERSNKTTKPPS